MFQRVGGGEPRLSLGAFGKHPGWADHIPGIGVETDILARVKQSLYVAGIGGQIDAGAWEKMEPERRLEGFDHSFIWLRDGHAVYGQFWSSTDGKGRAKYPMVVCVDGQGVSANFMLGTLPAGLDRLRDACKAATSAERVVADCGAAQEQLRGMIAQNATRTAETDFIRNAHRRFLEHSELGPDRLGLLRLLHELDSTAGLGRSRPAAPAGGRAHSRHFRVPLAAESRTEALGLWSGFLRCAAPEPTSILLISRNDVEWLDAILGEPVTDDFFCLQASPRAVPLVTEIPYHLSSALNARLQDLESKFAGTEKSSPAEQPKAPHAPAQPAPTQRSPATDSRSKTGIWKLFGVILILVAVGAVALVLRNRHGPDLAQAPPAPAPVPAKTTNEAPEQARADTTKPAVDEKVFRDALSAAQQALDSREYSLAIAKAVDALRLKPQDPAAIKIKQDAETARSEATRLAELDSRFTQALAAAQKSFAVKDYAAAIAKTEEALRLKPKDPVATQLRQEAINGQAEASRAVALSKSYNEAFAAARAAFEGKDFSAALSKVEEVLKLKPQDPSAMKLQQDVLAAQADAAKLVGVEQSFNVAFAAGQQAFQARDFALALNRAQEALRLKPQDAGAMKLAQTAEAAVAEATRAAGVEKQYAASVTAAREALARENFDEAEQHGRAALALKPSDPAGVALLAQAQESRRKKQLAAVVPTPVESAAKPGEKKNFSNGLGMEFVWIPGLAPGGAYIGKFEVTQRQFRSVTGKLPGQKADEDDLPVANVSFQESKDFCELLSRQESKHYGLPTRDEWLSFAGILPEQVKDAWLMLSARGAFNNEVTSWHVRPQLKLPRRGGSLGVGTNGLSDVLGNVREWLADGESAGFSYDSEGVGRRKSLFDTSTNLQEVTGFRCILREGQ